MISPERAFLNPRTNSIEQTHTYSFDGLNWDITLPKIPRQDFIKTSLLATRPFILRIGILYKHQSMSITYFGSGILITNRLILTCAHNFDPIQWADETVVYTKIYISFHDPACEMLFDVAQPNNSLIEAEIIRRGLINDNISDCDNIGYDTTDLALLSLDKDAPHIKPNEYFNPQLNLLSCKSNVNPINSKLFSIGYNGELVAGDLNAYRNLEGFQHLTSDKLNLYHHINQKSISIGHLIKEADEQNRYSLHTCSTLPGSSGSIILDCHCKMAGIHIGVHQSRKAKSKEIFFNKETYNKYVSIYSNQFQAFISETIIPHMNDDQTIKNWQFNS